MATLGQTLALTFTLTNMRGAHTLPAKTLITFSDTLPIGLSNVRISTQWNSGWVFTPYGHTSPLILRGTYRSAKPLPAGQRLPRIVLFASLNAQAGKRLSNTMTIHVAGDHNPSNNTVISTIHVVVPGLPLAPFTSTVTPTDTSATIQTATPIGTLTATSTVTPTSAGIVVPTITPTGTALVSAPDLSLSITHSGSLHNTVGKILTYTLSMHNGGAAITKQHAIAITNIIPLGLKNVYAHGNGWRVFVSDTTSPVVIQATYTGKYPIKEGMNLAPIFIQGLLDRDAIPSITTTANVATPGDSNPANNTDTDTIFVDQVISPTATPTVVSAIIPTVRPTMTTSPTGSPTVISSSGGQPTATPELTALPTPTATPLPSHILVPTPLPASQPISQPTPQPTPQPTSQPTPQPMMTPARLQLSLERSDALPDGHYVVGQSISYHLSVTNLAGSQNQMIRLLDIVSLGLRNLTISGTNWTFDASSNIGPAVFAATFNGPYPIAAGTVLPTVTLSGILTSAALPQLSTAVTVLSSNSLAGTQPMVVDTIEIQATSVPPVSPVHPTPIVATVKPAVQATPTPMEAVSASPTVVASLEGTVVSSLPVTPTMIHISSEASSKESRPALSLTSTTLYWDYAAVGHLISFELRAANAAGAGTIVRPDTIALDAVIPLGLSHIQTIGNDWKVTVSDTISPVVIHAQYIGKRAIGPGVALAPIIITGQLTADAFPILTSTATITVPHNSDAANHTAFATLLIQSASQNRQGMPIHPDYDHTQDIARTAARKTFLPL
ncbi:hypothetical protein KDI_32010 [Dictyobacter arantiisoli]|uniref:DUF11 domain-containing protein n=2 Tax=Dictyobacter arantiisoli TaxID=2014874 RepID=A0A5A5TE83_9CHLR|nr:hypothetical protein KDI_32010 [Dictyobacter arantiisoli]